MKTVICLSVILAAALGVLAWQLHRVGKMLGQIRAENIRLRSIFNMEQEQYEALNFQVSLLREMRHDLRHYIQTLEAGYRARDTIWLDERLQAFHGALDRRPLPAAEDWAVTSVIRYYQKKAEDGGIGTDFALAAGAWAEGIERTDLCLLLSNALENAVEAVGREPGGKGLIRLRFKAEEGWLSIVVGNTFTGALMGQRGRYLSSKADGRYGIGLETIQTIAQAYCGHAAFTADGQMFKMAATLFRRRVAEQG